jgi:hypothetical protein
MKCIAGFLRLKFWYKSQFGLKFKTLFQSSKSATRINGQKVQLNKRKAYKHFGCLNGKRSLLQKSQRKNQKEHWKICKPSLHHKSPLKWSLHWKSLCRNSQKLPMAFSPYEIRLKKCIGKFDEVIVFKVLKMITSSKFKNNYLWHFFNLIS